MNALNDTIQLSAAGFAGIGTAVRFATFSGALAPGAADFAVIA